MFLVLSEDDRVDDPGRGMEKGGESESETDINKQSSKGSPEMENPSACDIIMVSPNDIDSATASEVHVGNEHYDSVKSETYFPLRSYECGTIFPLSSHECGTINDSDKVTANESDSPTTSGVQVGNDTPVRVRKTTIEALIESFAALEEKKE